MSVASTPPFDDGRYRWAVNTSDDHSGTLYIFVFLGFTYSSFTFLTRLYIKWHMLGLDDAAMLAAQVADVVQFSLMLACLSAGLAKSFDILTEAQYSQMASTYASSQIAIYITLGISKLATILLVRRLFTKEMRDAWKTCTAVIGAIVLWTIASALLVSVGCPASSLSPRTASQTCPGLETRYVIVIITDALTDAVLAFIPTYLIRHLQMPMGFKLQVLGIFALRLPLVILTVLFFKAWQISLHSENPGVFRTGALVLQQAQVCSSLLASTIPCLKSFLRSFDTGSGVKPGLGSSSKSSGRYGHMSTIRHSKSQTPQHEETYCMDTLKTTVSSGSISPSGERERAGEPSASGRRSAMEEDTVRSNKSVDLDRRSSQRSTDQLFIRKDVQWTVKNEPAHGSAKNYKPGKLQLPK